VDFRHEDVIENPEAVLQQVCDVFELPCSQDYVQACAALVFPSPNKTREKHPWDPDLIELVARHIEDYPFLQSYTFEN
jgi:hypothetical protein